MKVGISISPEIFSAIKRDAKSRLVSESRIVREILARTYDMPAGLPKRIYPRQLRVRFTALPPQGQ